MMCNCSPWNSLELAKVIISIATPVIGGIIAWRLAKVGKDLEKKQWSSRKIIEKRLDFYDKVIPELNDLYCYYHRIGNWKTLTPKEIIDKKRFLDKEFHVYSHIFRKDIIKKYETFIHNCFETFTGWGNDAKIKMNLTKRIDLPDWKNEWNELFLEDKMESEVKFNSSYFDLMSVIKAELEI